MCTLFYGIVLDDDKVLPTIKILVIRLIVTVEVEIDHKGIVNY